LGGWDEEKLWQAFIADQCLAQAAATFNDIHQIIDDTVFQPEHNVQVAQADIRVYTYDFIPFRSQGSP